MSDFLSDYEVKVRALGEELQYGRELRGFSRKRVAKLLHVSEAQIWKFEEGLIENPSKPFMRKARDLVLEWKDEEDRHRSGDGNSYVLASSPNFVKVGRLLVAC